VAYTWDDAGHLLSDGARAYAWDAAGRLTQVVSGTHTTAYVYNGDGVRVRQTVNGATTSYVQDVAAPLPVVLTEQTAGQTTRYLYGLDLEAREQAAWCYYHSDGLGSVRHVTALEGWAVAHGYSRDYWAFGAVRATSGALDEYLFTGEQWDAAAGLYSRRVRARYYEPAVGRFLSEDPSCEQQGPGSLKGTWAFAVGMRGGGVGSQ